MIIKIDWDEIGNKVILYGILGIFALGLHLIITDAIDGHQDQETRISALEQHHADSLIPPEKIPLRRKVWNWITLKEFRK